MILELLYLHYLYVPLKRLKVRENLHANSATRGASQLPNLHVLPPYPELHEMMCSNMLTLPADKRGAGANSANYLVLRARSPSYSLWEDNTKQWYFTTGYITHYLYRNFLFFGTGRFQIGHNMNEIARKICHSSPEQKKIITKCGIYNIFLRKNVQLLIFVY